jgi:H/ACA ribonucleoprotein complex non-core subunit NAF1
MEYSHEDQPPAKKARTDAPASPAMSDEFDDADDFFDTPVKALTPSIMHEKQDAGPGVETASAAASDLSTHEAPTVSGSPPPVAAVSALAVSLVEPKGLRPPPPTPSIKLPEITLARSPLDNADITSEKVESAMFVASNEEAHTTEPPTEKESKLETANSTMIDTATQLDDSLANKADEDMQDIPQAITGTSETKPPVDPDFIAAAEAIKGDENAEWQYDSSNDDSSDDSSDSSDDSDDSDDDYVLLDPREQARILMAEEGGSDDEGGSKRNKGGGGGALRTANEKPDEVVEKPDVPVTPEMTIKELGHVEITVENYVLVKGTISAETQVLESGTVLCLADRTVIGAVAEPIGRVEEPRYSVAFTNAAEIKNYGITAGTKIYYVEKYAKYVFTGPLKLMKGTDASNQHDEELPEEEMEFSDDEAEAEYKRSKKTEKLIRQGKIKPDHMRPDPEPAMAGAPHSGAGTTHDTPLKYEDGDEDEDMYTPLARPANIEAAGMLSRPIQQSGRGGADRGRGRGRGGRDRGGDRGRGNRGGRGARGRGDLHHNGTSSPALSQVSQPASMYTPSRAAAAAASSPNAPTQSGKQDQPAPAASYQGQGLAQGYQQHQPQSAYQDQPPQSSYQSQAPQYGFPNLPPQAGYTPQASQVGYQNGYQGFQSMPNYPPQHQQQPMQWNLAMQGGAYPPSFPQSQYGVPPPGAHVNPAFFAAMQGQQGQTPAYLQHSQQPYPQNQQHLQQSQQQGRQNYGRGGRGQGY